MLEPDMEITERLGLRLGRSLPLLRQTEAAECGLACLGMVAAYHGHHTDMRAMRQRFSVSLKGMSLDALIKAAHQLDMSTRAVRLDLQELGLLKLPCILHWNFNHFVVLRQVGKDSVTLHDPAQGVRQLKLTDVTHSFTGVALEIWPAPAFQPCPPPARLKLRQLLSPITGLKRGLAQILLLAGILELFAIASPFFLQWVLDHAIVGADRHLLTTLAIGFGLLLLIQQLISALRSWALMYLGTTLGIHWRANVFRHLLHLPVQYFQKRHLGDVVSRFAAVDTIQSTVTSSFLAGILDGVMAVATLLLMLLYSPLLALVSMGAIALYALGRWLWYRPLRDAAADSIVKEARTQSHFIETVRGARAIQLFQGHQQRNDAWLSLQVEQVNAGLRIYKLKLAYQQWNGLLFGVSGVLVLWLGASRVMDNVFTVGMLMAFNAYKSQFDTRIAGLIDNFFEMRMLQLQGDRLADIVLTPPDIAPESGPCASLRGEVALAGVNYRYAQGEPAVLHDIDLTIRTGESVVIQGPSGCGKTTLMNVMLGILAPSEGRVTIDGTDLQRLGVDAYRSHVAAVMQDDALFAGSVADNIAFFANEVDHARVESCARIAQLHDSIVNMPMGYRTLVGDMGTVLSGGQKQRLLLARALYKQPRVLFLDEATCHLDPPTERAVVAALSELDITRIAIAHRAETIGADDRVITLVDGRIYDDSGKHVRESSRGE
jgi:ATP-binding cassette subfamily B protein RaxB